jgi:hypothetical protein
MGKQDWTPQTQEGLGNGLVRETWLDGRIIGYTFENSSQQIVDTWGQHVHSVAQAGLPKLLLVMCHYKKPSMSPYIRQQSIELMKTYRLTGYMASVIENTPLILLIKLVTLQVLRYQPAHFKIEFFSTRHAALEWLAAQLPSQD